MTAVLPSASALIRRGWITTAATLCAGLLTGPLANWYWATYGIVVLACFALSIVAATWLVLLAEWKLARKGHLVAGPMAGMAIRLLLPMSVCLIVVVLADDGPLENAVFLCIPMYVTMLVVDTFQAIAGVPKMLRRGHVGPIQAVPCSGMK